MQKGKAAQRPLMVPKQAVDLSQRLFPNTGSGAHLRDPGDRLEFSALSFAPGVGHLAPSLRPLYSSQEGMATVWGGEKETQKAVSTGLPGAALARRSLLASKSHSHPYDLPSSVGNRSVPGLSSPGRRSLSWALSMCIRHILCPP